MIERLARGLSVSRHRRSRAGGRMIDGLYSHAFRLHGGRNLAKEEA